MSDKGVAEVAGARESRAFFAALLAACRLNCTCETCEILRGVADSMAAEFKPGGARGVKGKGKD